MEVLSTTREIAANANALVRTMEEAVQVADETTQGAEQARSSLASMDGTMQRMVAATDSINAKLAALSEKSSHINKVLTTITKVADQTNLLSLNAAIEAEKAGEAGRGFSVVATEIRRLSDQTTAATDDIEQMLKDMNSAVSASVMGMDKFSEEIRRSVQEVASVSDQLAEVIEDVQKLPARFDIVLEGMQSQAVGAGQIAETITQLNDSTSRPPRRSRLPARRSSICSRQPRTCRAASLPSRSLVEHADPVFQLAEAVAALPTTAIRQVLPLLQLTRFPAAPAGVAGLMNLHGAAIPVVRRHRHERRPAARARQDTRILLVDFTLPEGGSRPLGLVVEGVAGVRRVTARAPRPAGVRLPDYPGSARCWRRPRASGCGWNRIACSRRPWPPCCSRRPREARSRLAPLVRARTGLAIADDMLGRAIRQRLRERQEGDAEAYMARILDDEGEFADLLDLLVIPETWFFRDPQAIAHAARFAQERHARSGAPVRLLSLPCSTGEEPYTLAMALFDTGLPHRPSRSPRWTSTSRPWSAPAAASMGAIPFAPATSAFAIAISTPRAIASAWPNGVRTRCAFARANILQLGSLRDGAPFDVVLCRNLLIYFDDQTQGRALSHLAALMHDDGLLCVGSSEMVSAMRHGFASLGVAHASALVKRQAAGAEPARPHPQPASPRRKAAVRPPPPAPPLPTRLRARSTPAPAPITPVASSAQPLEEAQRLADAGRGAEAEALLRNLLEADRSQAGAHFLLALILPDDRAAEAERALRQALYLEPGHYPALCRLALICERAGRLDEAGRLRERAARIQTRAGDDA